MTHPHTTAASSSQILAKLLHQWCWSLLALVRYNGISLTHSGHRLRLAGTPTMTCTTRHCCAKKVQFYTITTKTDQKINWWQYRSLYSWLIISQSCSAISNWGYFTRNWGEVNGSLTMALTVRLLRLDTAPLYQVTIRYVRITFGKCSGVCSKFCHRGQILLNLILVCWSCCSSIFVVTGSQLLGPSV